MAITPPVPIPPAPALPQRNDPATFEARADAYYAWQSEALPDGIDAQADATFTNAQEAAQSAQTAEDEKDLAIQARQGAENARDAAQGFAEDASDAEDSAWAAAAAAQAGSLPQPLEPGKVLGAISPTAVGWVSTVSHVEIIETSQTWTPPYYPFTCIIDGIGGGGGSGSGSSAGGAGSGYIDGPVVITLDQGDTLQIIIGAGGALSEDGGDTTVSQSGVGEVLNAPGGKTIPVVNGPIGGQGGSIGGTGISSPATPGPGGGTIYGRGGIAIAESGTNPLRNGVRGGGGAGRGGLGGNGVVRIWY